MEGDLVKSCWVIVNPLSLMPSPFLAEILPLISAPSAFQTKKPSSLSLSSDTLSRTLPNLEEGKVTKPVVAYIGGKAAKSGTRFSHAGAIVEGGRGTYEGKVDRLRQVGVTVADEFGDLPTITKSVLKEHGIL